VAPGLIDTGMIMMSRRTARANQERVPLARSAGRRSRSRHSLPRGDDASYLTGQIITVDGGLGI
jgi:NAD(P)-dependent dehydrogenase (short-subunit alcohol dehydrogenase family)